MCTYILYTYTLSTYVVVTLLMEEIHLKQLICPIIARVSCISTGAGFFFIKGRTTGPAHARDYMLP